MGSLMLKHFKIGSKKWNPFSITIYTNTQEDKKVKLVIYKLKGEASTWGINYKDNIRR